MNHYDIPKYLCRKSESSKEERVSCAEVWTLAFLGFILFIAMFGVLMIWGMTRAEIAYAGVIRDGQIYTPQEFCNGL